MREKISVAAVATIIVVVSSVIVANWSHVRQVLFDFRPLEITSPGCLRAPLSGV
jgi:hypothetical protein